MPFLKELYIRLPMKDFRRPIAGLQSTIRIEGHLSLPKLASQKSVHLIHDLRGEGQLDTSCWDACKGAILRHG